MYYAVSNPALLNVYIIKRNLMDWYMVITKHKVMGKIQVLKRTDANFEHIEFAPSCMVKYVLDLSVL